MKQFPRLKFCGITREVDVESAIALGVSALGFNFYPKSKRYVALRIAARLSQLSAGRIQRVGVFVNATPQHVADVNLVCELDAIQLHGDESPGWVEEAVEHDTLRDLPILRALPYRGPQDDALIGEWARMALKRESAVSAIVVDAFDPIERGGTGRTARWDLLFPRPACFCDPLNPQALAPGSPNRRALAPGSAIPLFAPLILAGGIRPENVFEACSIAHPDGIDVASGIETAPGIKDPAAMARLVERVNAYFDDQASEAPRLFDEF